MLVARKRFKYYGSLVHPGEKLDPQPKVGTSMYQRLLDGRYIEEEGADRTEGYECRNKGCNVRLVSLPARAAHEREAHGTRVRQAPAVHAGPE